MKGFADSLQSIKAKGNTLIGCFPLYPPLELLHSFGLTPVVLWGMEQDPSGFGLSDRHLQPYACSVARCLTEFILSQGHSFMDALFMYNACDTLRNLPEIITGALKEKGQPPPVFRLHVPAVSLHEQGAARYLDSRIKGLIADLTAFTGREFSEHDFLRSIRLYHRQRSLCLDLEDRAAKGITSFADCSDALMAGHRLPVEDHMDLLEKSLLRPDMMNQETAAGSRPTIGGTGNSLDKGHSVMISGILPPARDLIETMENAGLTIAANDIAALKRSYASFAAETPDPVAFYTDFYENHYPCPTILPSADRRLEAIRDAVARHGIRGFIFIGEKFCEYEYFEYPHIESMLGEMGVRSLFIETGTDSMTSQGAYRTRIETFARMLDG